jgi:hypothetical protein
MYASIVQHYLTSNGHFLYEINFCRRLGRCGWLYRVEIVARHSHTRLACFLLQHMYISEQLLLTTIKLCSLKSRYMHHEQGTSAHKVTRLKKDRHWDLPK